MTSNIDLNKFVRSYKVIVPVHNRKFIYNRKSFENFYSSEDGWYKVEINGNSAKIIEPVVIETSEHNFNTIKGYVYNNNIIFQNFDVGKRKLGKDIMTRINFCHQDNFTAVEAIIWENNLLYYYKNNYSDFKSIEVKSLFDNKENISGVSGLTPELKTLYLFNDIERIKLEEEQEKIRKENEVREMMRTFQGRLMHSFNRVGGQIIDYSITGNKVRVHWKLLSTGTDFNSVIEKDTMRVIEAGYCMEGDDRRHNVVSMILTAEDYDKEGLIYKYGG